MKRIDKRKIKQLVSLSLTEGRLDPRKIGVVTSMVRKRDELSYYYQLLLQMREKERVIVATAIPVPKQIAQRMEKLFEDRDILFRKDPGIIAGLKVAFSDFIFDASIKHYFEQLRREYEIN